MTNLTKTFKSIIQLKTPSNVPIIANITKKKFCDQMKAPSTAIPMESDPDVVESKGPPPELGGECCMSGCANCVWVKYAEDTLAYYEDGGEKAMVEIEKIEDSNLKAFIKLQIKLKNV